MTACRQYCVYSLESKEPLICLAQSWPEGQGQAAERLNKLRNGLVAGLPLTLPLQGYSIVASSEIWSKITERCSLSNCSCNCKLWKVRVLGGDNKSKDSNSCCFTEYFLCAHAIYLLSMAARCFSTREQFSPCDSTLSKSSWSLGIFTLQMRILRPRERISCQRSPN